MKRILVCLVFVVSLLHAQEVLPCDSILPKLAQMYESFSTINVDLMITMYDGAEETPYKKYPCNIKIKSGKFYMVSEKDEVIYDGKKVYFINNEYHEMYETSYESFVSDDEVTPLNLLSFYGTGFTCQSTGVKKDGQGNRMMTIMLLPRQNKKFKYASVKLIVNLDQWRIYASTLKEKGGDEVTFMVSSFESDTDLNDSLFIYSKARYPSIRDKSWDD